MVPNALLLHHYTYVYLLNTHVKRIAILRQHASVHSYLTAYRWKDRHRSLHLDPHCVCRRESAHSSPCLILFIQALPPSHILFIQKKKKSMYKARFIIASRSSSCTFIQDNVSHRKPLLHTCSPAATLFTPHLPLSSHCIYYTSSSQHLHLWNLFSQAYLSPSRFISLRAIRAVLLSFSRHFPMVASFV